MVKEPMTISAALSNKIRNAGFIAACFVPALHIHTQLDSECFRLIYMVVVKGGLATIAVPAFFTISVFLLAGHFAESGWYPLVLRKRLKSLLLPFVLWALLYWLLSVAIKFAAARVGLHFVGLSEFNPVRALGLDLTLMPQMSHLWYLRSLFVYVLFAPVYRLLLQNRNVGMVFIGSEIILNSSWAIIIDHSGDWQLDFMKDAWLWGSLYFSIGIWLRYHGKSCLRIKRAGLLMFVGLVLFGLVNAVQVPHFVKDIAVWVSLIGAWAIIPSTEWSKKFTSASMPIYLMHSAVITFIVLGQKLFGVHDIVSRSFLCFMFEWLIVVFACIVLNLLIRRFGHGISGVLFGGR